MIQANFTVQKFYRHEGRKYIKPDGFNIFSTFHFYYVCANCVSDLYK